MDIQVGNISNALCLNNNDPDKLNVLKLKQKLSLPLKVKIQLKNP
jgi:hypothetical protein